MSQRTVRGCILLAALAALVLLVENAGRAGEQDAAAPAAAPTLDWDAVRAEFKTPEWFADAKFGIYAHWGVYSVPAYENEWYPRNMYLRSDNPTSAFQHHIATWGDQSVFGYREFIPMFKAEKWDPTAWAKLYKAAGAKFAGPAAEHHDGFSLWDSQVNPWNSVAMGPKRNLTKELTDAIRAEGLKVVITLHHDYNVLYNREPNGFYPKVEGWDTTDPKYCILYGNFSSRDEAYKMWLDKTKEIIDKFLPDELWFDGWLAQVPENVRYEMVTYYYAKAREQGKQVTVTYKGSSMPRGTALRDIERGGERNITPDVWQTDDSISPTSWCYTEGLRLYTLNRLLYELIDITSKNGVLMLNIAPKADGTIPEDQQALLLSLGKWLEMNGEAIYGSRPWVTYGEGTTPELDALGRGMGGRGRRGATPPAQAEGALTVRYTTKGDTLYAMILGDWPGAEAVLPTLGTDSTLPKGGKVERVTMLGSQGELKFTQDADGLKVQLPAEKPCDLAYTLKITGLTLK